ncbi:hypothetical protein LIA77_11757 [Sarocladium implicatum]|nr:hypothetical protein LIA77_11757 [Sarocladium implicatum]
MLTLGLGRHRLASFSHGCYVLMHASCTEHMADQIIQHRRVRWELAEPRVSSLDVYDQHFDPTWGLVICFSLTATSKSLVAGTAASPALGQILNTGHLKSREFPKSVEMKQSLD